MRIALTDAQQELANQLAAYFSALMTPERRADLASGDGEAGTVTAYREVIKQLGTDGWLGIGWPREYGGQQRSAMEQLLFTDAASDADLFVPQLTLGTVGPTIMAFGTPEQKRAYLPPILRGDLHFSIGYSEPGSGTDLASITTRARIEGDEFVISGQKMWISLLEYADYFWLACRTDPDAPKHKGLSIIIVPIDTPGLTRTPVRTVAGQTVSAVYLDEVRVPVANLVGDLHGGWRLMTNQLNHERVALTSSALQRRLVEDVAEWVRTAPAESGGVLADQQWVRLLLGRARARVEALTLMNYEIASAPPGHLGPVEASGNKVYGSELALETYRALHEVVGPSAALRAGSPGAVLSGRLERAYRSSLVMTFGGGTNEVQRDIIASVGLGLPAARR